MNQENNEILSIYLQYESRNRKIKITIKLDDFFFLNCKKKKLRGHFWELSDKLHNKI